MAGTEVSKELSEGVSKEVEKCAVDMNSHRDLLKPECNGSNHHNQTNDFDNSYVFVTGADDLPNVAVDNKEVDDEVSSVLPDPSAAPVKDQGAKPESRGEKLDAVSGECSEPANEGDNENADRGIGDPAVVADSAGGARKSDEETGQNESLAEVEVKQLENPDGKVESSEAVVSKKIEDKTVKLEGVVEGEQKNLDNLIKSGLVPGLIENQESEVGALGSVADSGESGEVSNKSSYIANGECGDRVELKAIETSKACEESPNLAVAVVEYELQDASVEAEAEVKVDLHPINNKEVIPKEEVIINLSLDVLENEQGDTTIATNSEGVQERVNEAKSVPSSMSCHVETVSVEKDEEVSVAHVENGKSVRSSVGYVVEKVLVEKDKEEVSESHVDNGKSVLNSHVGTVLYENKDDFSVSHVDNGPCPEEPEKHPYGSDASREIVQSVTNGEASVPNSHVEMVLSEKDKDSVSVSHVANGKSLLSSNVESVLLEKNKDDISVCHADNGILHPEEPEEYPNGSEAPSEILQCETNDEASVPNSHVKMVLLEKEKEDVSVSHVEDGVESVLLEKNKDDISVCHVDNGILHPEEPEEYPNSSEAPSEILHRETNDEASVPNSHVKMVLLEKDKEDVSVSHVDNGIPRPEEPEYLNGSGASLEIMLSDTNTGASVPTQSFPPSNAHVPQTEAEISDAETVEAVSSSPPDGKQSQIIENESSSGSGSTIEAVVTTGKEPTSQSDEVLAEIEVSSGKAKVANSPHATFDVKFEPADHDNNFPALSSVRKTGDVTFGIRTGVSDSSNVKKEDTTNIVEDSKDVEGMGDQLGGAADEDTGDSLNSNLSVASPEGSSKNTIEGEEAVIKTVPKTKPFNFLVRIPRFDDDNLREQIRLAKLHVDEKTKLRDAIQVQIQELRANNQIHGIDYEYAKGEARSARKLVKSKRMEIDSLQYLINKAKNALSIDDIDSQMFSMEHTIQHETLDLKEEKKLIRTIKQLKQLREQLSSNMGSQDEIKQALEQREEVEARLKVLRKELDVLKDKVVKAESAAKDAEMKYDDQNKKVKELQTQFRAADDVRQAAYAQWQNLKKELSKKSKPFFKYKDDAAIATNFAFSRDMEALYRLCTNQVENVMELWNKNAEFRKEYVKFNTRSTIRRFGTLDGRSLGPDEKPLNLPSNSDERIHRMVSTPAKVDSISQIPNPDLKQETTVESVTSDGKSMKKATEQRNHKVTNKEPPSTTPVQVNGMNSVAVSSKEDIDEVHEEPKKSIEELELMRKEEEMKRAEAEAKLKEQRRLEALAKAHEARERKKRQAEKLQMRAELKTQKEAEQREKEREKRLRKKERKKAAASIDVNDTNSNSETAPSSESATEITGKDTDIKETPSVAPKKPKKPWLFSKQSKTKSVVPPPLRNRNKKKLQQWMWVGFTSLIILFLFWMGNMGLFANVNLKRRGPVY